MKYISLDEAEKHYKECLKFSEEKPTSKEHSILQANTIKHSLVWKNIIERIKNGEQIEK